MSNLLSANFSRLKKSKLFWICSLFMAILGMLFSIGSYISNCKFDDIAVQIPAFAFVQFTGIVVSVFCSLFLGSEYSDGTIRNKLMIGHKRCHLYLANLITAAAASILTDIAYLLPCLAIGIPLLHGFDATAGTVIAFFLVNFLLTICFASIFTLIAMLCQNKALSVAASILTAFIVLFTGVYLTSKLNEPETWDSFVYMDTSGEIKTEEAMPNPNYVSGTKRDVYEFLNDFLPGGQQLSLSQMQAGTHGLGFFALSSGIIIAVTSAAGIVCFDKKDLK